MQPPGPWEGRAALKRRKRKKRKKRRKRKQRKRKKRKTRKKRERKNAGWRGQEGNVKTSSHREDSKRVRTVPHLIACMPGGMAGRMAGRMAGGMAGMPMAVRRGAHVAPAALPAPVKVPTGW